MDIWELDAREAVRHTIAAYTFGGDRGVLEELGAAFTVEGSLQIGDDAPIEGRKAIVDQLGSVLQVDPAPTFVHHHIAGVHFRSVAPDRIETASYFQVLTDVGLDHWGRYRDSFAPVAGRWLIESRRVATDGFSPQSFFA